MFTSTYIKLQLALEQFKKDQRGVTSIEYAIIGVAIAAIVAAVFADDGVLSTALTNAINAIGDSVSP